MKSQPLIFALFLLSIISLSACGSNCDVENNTDNGEVIGNTDCGKGEQCKETGQNGLLGNAETECVEVSVPEPVTR